MWREGHATNRFDEPIQPQAKIGHLAIAVQPDLISIFIAHGLFIYLFIFPGVLRDTVVNLNIDQGEMEGGRSIVAGRKAIYICILRRLKLRLQELVPRASWVPSALVPVYNFQIVDYHGWDRMGVIHETAPPQVTE